MKNKVTVQLREEARKFRLRFACSHCAYFEPKDGSCSEGYPNHEHLDEELRGSHILFCKLFETS